MMRTRGKGLTWLFFVLLLGIHILRSQAESPEGEELVRFVDKEDAKSEEGSDNTNNDAVELERADVSDTGHDVHNPEHVYEACASLQESFKDCSKDELTNEFLKLVDACSDPVLHTKEVISTASGVAASSSSLDISGLSECQTMIVTSSIFISSSTTQASTEEEPESLEVESLETDSSQMGGSELDEG